MKMPRLARIATGAIKINQGVENQPWSHGSREVHIRPLRKFWRRRVINRAFTGPAPFNSCFSYLLNMLIGWYHSYHIMSIGIVYFFKSFCARLDTPTARAAGFPALLFVNPRLKIICGPRAMNRCGPHLEELLYTHRFPCRFVWPFPAPHSDPSANVFSSAIAITVPYPIWLAISRSRAIGDPPRWIWPRIVTRESMPSVSRILLPFLRLPPPRSCGDYVLRQRPLATFIKHEQEKTGVNDIHYSRLLVIYITFPFSFNVCT